MLLLIVCIASRAGAEERLCTVPGAVPGDGWSADYKTKEVEFECPACGEVFKGKSLNEAVNSTGGGYDSDMCVYALDPAYMDLELETCPECYYTRTDDVFANPIPPEKRFKITKLLGTVKEEFSESGFASAGDLKTWHRYELFARIRAAGRDRAVDVGNLFVKAAHALRAESTLEATRRFKPRGIRRAHNLIHAEIEYLSIGEKPEKKPLIILWIIQLAHRGGFLSERDAYLDYALKLPEMTENISRRLKELKPLFDAEKKYLSSAIKYFKRAFDGRKLTTSSQLDRYTYAVAELARRIGDSKTSSEWFKLVTMIKEVKSAPAFNPDEYSSTADNWVGEYKFIEYYTAGKTPLKELGE